MLSGSNSGDHLGQRLVYEACVPLSCEAIDDLPRGYEYSSIQSDNEEVLHAIMLVEDAPKENPDDSGAEGQEILRLEYKINLMFELLTGLYQREAALPDAVNIALRSDAVEWHSSQPTPAKETLVRLKLYLSTKYPKPLVLHGRVMCADQDDCSEKVCVVFDDAVSDRCRDWIDKYIFRHHRRAVALAKRDSRVDP